MIDSEWDEYTDDPSPSNGDGNRRKRPQRGRRFVIELVSKPGNLHPLHFEAAVRAAVNAGMTKYQLEALMREHPQGCAGPYLDRLCEAIDEAWAKVATFPDLVNGKPRETAANARVAIPALGIVCRYDIFHDRLKIAGEAIRGFEGNINDYALQTLRVVIHDRFGFDPGKVNTKDALIQLGLKDQFDPICEYLASLQWDGTKRLDHWLRAYLGADESLLNSAIGKLTLVAAVRRARKPGTKFDQIIVLEGVEGTFKSTAIAVLAGDPENFSDQTIFGLRVCPERSYWIA